MKLNGQTVKIGYKVVSTYWPPKLYSYLGKSITGSIEYKINEWVQPLRGCGPLMVFKDKSSACNFAWMPSTRVYGCWYVPSKQKKIWAGASQNQIFSSYEDLADSVYLIEKIINDVPPE